MSLTRLTPLFISALLTACASTPMDSPSKHISQSGSLRAHPGLLGKPVPAELADRPVSSPSAAIEQNQEQPMKLDEIGLRTQRSIYFDLNSAAIKPDYTPVLQEHAHYLAKTPKARLRIEGNADERGPASYNVELSKKRADNVRLALIEHGAKSKQILIKPLGATHPKKTGKDEESWAENRRADLVYEREK